MQFFHHYPGGSHCILSGHSDTHESQVEQQPTSTNDSIKPQGLKACYSSQSVLNWWSFLDGFKNVKQVYLPLNSIFCDYSIILLRKEWQGERKTPAERTRKNEIVTLMKNYIWWKKTTTERVFTWCPQVTCHMHISPFVSTSVLFCRSEVALFHGDGH